MAIARALALKPQVMLFDEPTSALDPELVGSVIDAIRALRSAGMTMIVVSHVLAQAFRSDRQVAGHVELNIEGVRQGEAVRLGLSDLRPDAASNRLKFSFRYFQDLKADLVLPRGFSPRRVIVKITPQGKSAKTVEESFDWAVKPG